MVICLMDSEGNTLRFDYKQGALYYFTEIDEETEIEKRRLTYREVLKLYGGKDLLESISDL